MERVLVTGGAGYVGAVLIKHLLRAGFGVTVVDNLMYNNGTSLIPHFSDSNFAFQLGDVRDEELMKRMVTKVDFVVHLAAIVGFPACEKDPDLATSTNLEATKLLSRLLSKEQGVLYGSTGSNYGVVDGICTEETPLNPISLYGRTKTEAEKYLLDHSQTVAYRFATAFGLSPRMRLDLMVNDFVYQAAVNRYLIMFEKDFKRTFIHVEDMASALAYALVHFDDMKGKVFNVGDSRNNFSKEEVARMIQERLDYYLHFAEIGEDQDKRNYVVSYEKINETGFKAQVSVPDGIKELISAVPALIHRGPHRNV